MFQLFEKGYYSYDYWVLEGAEHPDLQDFRTWLKTSGEFNMKALLFFKLWKKRKKKDRDFAR
jgi:hypothetical protein